MAITNTTVTSTPKDYPVGGSQALQVKAVRAVYDGSLAVTSFLPVLQMLAPDGTVMWEAAPTGSIAAGGSADVNWFPVGSGGAGGGGVQTFVGARIRASSTQTVTTATNTDLVYQTVDFDTDGMANLGASAKKLTVNTPGIYLVTCETAWTYNSAGRRITVITHNGFYASGTVADATGGMMAVWAPVGGVGGGNPHTGTTALCLLQLAAGDFIASGCFQASGGNLDCNGGASGSGGADAYLAAVLVGLV